uniref:DUF4195 domain-containing protein n=1 Tax=Canis lupus familiaris TaxID=9615 RepID=A0A8C0NZS6_CANLF
MDDDNDNPSQSKNNSKMAELFMECEEEELEPWQKKVEEILDEDDDELIFVGEISSSKPAISNILNRGNPSSSSKGIKNETLTQGATDPFKPASQHYKDPTSNPVAALPRCHPESKSSQNSIVQNVSKPVSVSETTQLAQGHIEYYNTQLELWTIIASHHSIITIRKCHYLYDNSTNTCNCRN